MAFNLTRKRLASYDPATVIFTWGGVPLPIGVSSGSFIRLERVKKLWRLVGGVDGEQAPVRSNSFVGLASFRMRQAALNNTALSTLLKTNEITGTYLGLRALPFFLTDAPSGQTLWHSPQAMLEGWPPAEYGESENDVEWVLLCPELFPFQGGRS